ncbi:MAG: nucleotide exchange factor GrpE [Alphaproteobacteria bacterium]|nr:nucleotide exchange factor GrpE [Alphaproteobacteria bacterium]MBU6472676.1 nucleotide exchange factor GrpE [Alphaproteobacteria bacterium]MDE2012283.1 nucleotide exchange factor GrpE [Alphaproteobacteria bacterium]MDE2072850.1 nucleotide exchange factor GrpE [Alphaproteobacteria bacterium]MDE2351722.1 nucleotide exchange factor GrpE [Alphaproteobacteria bacterium]
MSDDDNDYIPENQANGAAGEEPEEVKALKAEIAELKDRALRALAEAENTRRRAEREKQDASQYAISRFARDMLQVADNFARAIAACPAEVREAAPPQLKAVIEGVEVTDRQLIATLEQHGIKQIDTTNAKFDPNLHQAIAEVPGGGKPAGTIVDVVQVGYQIGERLLRPAMVTVAKKEDGATPQPGGTVDTNA